MSIILMLIHLRWLQLVRYVCTAEVPEGNTAFMFLRGESGLLSLSDTISVKMIGRLVKESNRQDLIKYSFSH